MTTTQVNSIVNSMSIRALNFVEIRRDYKVAQCSFCWAEFRMKPDYEVEFNSVELPTVNSAVKCPCCDNVSYILCWMDENNIPDEISLFVK